MVNVKPPFTVRFPMVIAVAGATIPELIMILSPAAGTPAGDQLAAVAQAVPVEVLVTCAYPSADTSRNENSSIKGCALNFMKMGLRVVFIIHLFWMRFVK
jgi:hypothetical protein